MMSSATSSATSPIAADTRPAWKPITAMLAAIAAIAGLISNVDTIVGLFTPSVSGTWLLTATTKSSSLRHNVGMRTTFEIVLTQSGRTISGSGEKIMVNDEAIPTRQRQPIQING